MSQTNLPLNQWLDEAVVWVLTIHFIAVSVYVFTLNPSVIRLVDACLHSAISLQKKPAEKSCQLSGRFDLSRNDRQAFVYDTNTICPPGGRHMNTIQRRMVLHFNNSLSSLSVDKY